MISGCSTKSQIEEESLALLQKALHQAGHCQVGASTASLAPRSPTPVKGEFGKAGTVETWWTNVFQSPETIIALVLTVAMQAFNTLRWIGQSALGSGSIMLIKLDVEKFLNHSRLWPLMISWLLRMRILGIKQKIHEGIVVTNNDKEFIRIEGLRIENWVK